MGISINSSVGELQLPVGESYKLFIYFEESSPNTFVITVYAKTMTKPARWSVINTVNGLFEIEPGVHVDYDTGEITCYEDTGLHAFLDQLISLSRIADRTIGLLDRDQELDSWQAHCPEIFNYREDKSWT